LIQKMNLYVVCMTLLLAGSDMAWSQQVGFQPGTNEEIPTGQNWQTPGQVQLAAHATLTNPGPTVNASTSNLNLQSTRLGRKRVATTISSLVVAAGLMLGFMWLSRRVRTSNTLAVPGDLVEVIGKVALDSKHRAHLVRFGDRLLLLSLQGSGVSKLGEIPFAELSRATGSGRPTSPNQRSVGDVTLTQARLAHPKG
jgi:flagellar biogenesis protein FliO